MCLHHAVSKSFYKLLLNSSVRVTTSIHDKHNNCYNNGSKFFIQTPTTAVPEKSSFLKLTSSFIKVSNSFYSQLPKHSKKISGGQYKTCSIPLKASPTRDLSETSVLMSERRGRGRQALDAVASIEEGRRRSS